MRPVEIDMEAAISGRTDMASRRIEAPAARLYRAFLDPEALMAWLPPTGMSGRLLVFEPRVGGRYRMVLTYQDPDLGGAGKSTANSDIAEGRFVELVPDRRIVQSVQFDSDDPAFSGTMTIRWTFEPAGAGTLVTILCENVPEGIGEADHQAGLSASLANLAGYAERRPTARPVEPG